VVASVFVDTNVLLYAVDASDATRRADAEHIVRALNNG
jgi:predicted nucleic acid-binding protein